MMPGTFLFLLFLTDAVWTQKVCSYQDVLDYLNLTKGNDVYRSTRPVLDHTHVTMVKLDIILYAILSVVEKTQTFIPLIWLVMSWKNERISWDPAQFCGITDITIPHEMLWQPDLFIYEMTEKDDSHQNPYLHVSHEGTVTIDDNKRVVSTCKMDVHKFPFDTQNCNITVSSAAYKNSELLLIPFSNSSRATWFSRQVMKTQGEWEFLGLSVSNITITYNQEEFEQITYTINMRRRPLLHVINFLLPVLFLLCLDLSTFLISDERGEKLGFKVTVLLAISVLLLILNEILPSMSNKTPVIATYCIVIFTLMLLSLLETVLVTYLMEKDRPPQGNDVDRNHCLRERVCKQQRGNNHKSEKEEDKWTRCVCIYNVSGVNNIPGELLPTAEEVNDGKQPGDANVLLTILEELREVQKVLALSLGKGGEKAGYWTRVARGVNVVFFIFYISAITLFLTLVYIEWSS